MQQWVCSRSDALVEVLCHLCPGRNQSAFNHLPEWVRKTFSIQLVACWRSNVCLCRWACAVHNAEHRCADPSCSYHPRGRGTNRSRLLVCQPVASLFGGTPILLESGALA